MMFAIVSFIKSRTMIKSASTFFYVLSALMTALWVSIHLFYPDIFFDADQAVIGLMAEDLLHGRAFPWTYYGQKYLFAIEAWGAALSFLIFGNSLLALKLPLAVVHIVTAILTVRIFIKDARLAPFPAFLSATPMLMPSIVAGAYLMGANGANAWSAFYLVLLWILRDRFIMFGLLLGAAYFHREFTIFGALALILCDVLGLTEKSQSEPKMWWKPRLYSILIAQVTYHSLVGLGQFNANWSGGGRPRMPLVPPSQIINNFRFLIDQQLPTILGFSEVPVKLFGLNSGVDASYAGFSIVSFLALVAFILVLAFFVVRRTSADQKSVVGFPIYATLATAGQMAAYILFISNNETVLARYLLLVPLGLAGLFGLSFLHASFTNFKLYSFTVVTCVCLLLGNLLANWNLLSDRIRNPWQDPRSSLANRLIKAGYKYGWAPYWDAYYLKFITGESLVVASSDHTRFTRYRDLVAQHQNDAFVITPSPDLCFEPSKVQVGVWFICNFHDYRGKILALTPER